jgi:hypothetical protein
LRNSRHTRWSYRAGAVSCALIAVLVAVPQAAAVDPAISEYAPSFPNAKGKSYPGADTPSANSSELTPAVRQALRGRPDGKALAAIATSPELGAPETKSGSGQVVGGDTPSALSALTGALDDAPVILGLIALLAMVGLFWFLARGRPEESEA